MLLRVTVVLRAKQYYNIIFVPLLVLLLLQHYIRRTARRSTTILRLIHCTYRTRRTRYDCELPTPPRRSSPAQRRHAAAAALCGFSFGACVKFHYSPAGRMPTTFTPHTNDERARTHTRRYSLGGARGVNIIIELLLRMYVFRACHYNIVVGGGGGRAGGARGGRQTFR
ncbi:unnamed protein product [Aphis gossypii]|uniref:Uncharacterized protein n=1 Tax=Aphis gossypii TaxID=80765 RepID=A0A9P0JAU6_APHGO|nr:unnamed protein product [Aphis gossypii]